MSSGDSELPPTYYFSGITFNPSFYTSDYITNATGKKYFLSYPIAQGTETISTLIASTINSSASNDTVNLFNNITNGTIYLGNIIGTTANLMGNIFIGNGSNSTATTGNGTCSINKLQVGNTTTGNGIGTGTPYRCMIIGRNVGSTTGATGTITISGAPSGAGNPLVFASLNATTTSNPYFLTVQPTSTNTFDYYKTFYNRSGTTFNNAIVGATGETFNYVAIWL